MLKSTLIGGAVAGAVAGLPVLGALNCACCALIVGGGFLASFLYSRECVGVGVPFRAGNGAIVGLVAGMFYAIAATVVSGVVQSIVPPPDAAEIVAQLRQFMDVPPEAEDYIHRFAGEGRSMFGMIIGFFFNLILAAIFSTVGGLIGGAVFKSEPAPPPVG